MFVDFSKRVGVMCAACRSLERTRILKMALDDLDLQSGMRVIHFGPEVGIARHLRRLLGNGYEPCDLDPARYAADIGTRRFDLVEEAEFLPDEHYDLVIHIHVMEHLPCDVTAVLWHLHRSLKKTGKQIFAVPIFGGHYACSFAPMSDDERTKLFAQNDHMRRYGREDIARTLGLVFELPEPDAEAQYGSKRLIQHNIPPGSWKGWSSDTVMVLNKQALKLK